MAKKDKNSTVKIAAGYAIGITALGAAPVIGGLLGAGIKHGLIKLRAGAAWYRASEDAAALAEAARVGAERLVKGTVQNAAGKTIFRKVRGRVIPIRVQIKG